MKFIVMHIEGTWLTFLPSAWSLSLATPVGQLPNLQLISLFALGAFFMRSAGCTINDMWDRDFDSQVRLLQMHVAPIPLILYYILFFIDSS